MEDERCWLVDELRRTVRETVSRPVASEPNPVGLHRCSEQRTANSDAPIATPSTMPHTAAWTDGRNELDGRLFVLLPLRSPSGGAHGVLLRRPAAVLATHSTCLLHCTALLIAHRSVLSPLHHSIASSASRAASQLRSAPFRPPLSTMSHVSRPTIASLTAASRCSGAQGWWSQQP